MSFVFTVLVACRSGTVGPVDTQGPPGPPVETSAPTESETAPTSETEVHTETESESESETHSESVPIDTLPVETGLMDPAFTFEPPGGTFVGTAEVRLETSAGATVYYAIETDRVGPYQAYTGPILLESSAVIRAYVTRDGYVGPIDARSYVEVDSEVSAFSSNLPLLVLMGYGPAPTSTGTPRQPFAINLFEPDGDGRASPSEVPTLSVRGGLKVRGSSSSGYPKHPYSLESWLPAADDDLDVPLLDLPAESDWILYAPLDFDRAMMRNNLAFEMSNRVGRYAPRARFVEVFLGENGQTLTNGQYIGVYVVMEKIKQDPDRVAIESLSSKDVLPPALTGGYIFKHDRLGPGESGFIAGTAGGRFSMTLPMVYEDPEESEVVPEQSIYLSAYLDTMAAALAAPDFLDPASGAHYDTLLDVGSFMDHHIVNVLTKNPDAFRLSGYYHKDREGPVVAGPVWDFDRTMGCASDSRCDDPEWWDASNVTGDTTYVWDYGWYDGLHEDPAYMAAYWARWRSLLGKELSMAELTAIIDGYAAELSEAAPRNFERWNSYPPRGGTFASEVLILEQWLAARHAWILACLDLPDPRACHG